MYWLLGLLGDASQGWVATAHVTADTGVSFDTLVSRKGGRMESPHAPAPVGVRLQALTPTPTGQLTPVPPSPQ